MREDQICRNCKSIQRVNPDYYKNKFKTQTEQNEKKLKKMREYSEETSWDEIKIAREIWPPNIEKILFRYYRAEAKEPEYFQIFKDRARLYYVLNQIEKSNEEYGRWRKLDVKWEIEVDIEIDLRKNFSNKNIYPWEKLKKYFEKDSEVIKREFERADRKENRVERYKIEQEERKEQEERRRVEQEGRKERRIEKNRNKREREKRSREEERGKRSIISNYHEDSNENYDSDDNIEFIYYDQDIFETISTDIKNGIKHTYESITKASKSFEIYFKYLEKIDEKGNLNFKKLYEYCKIKTDSGSTEEKINESKFSDYYSSNKKYLDRWTTRFCETFIVFYQNYHNMSINAENPVDIKKILENKINQESNEFENKVIVETNNEEKSIPDENKILEECDELIKNYKKRTSISEHNIGLMEDMIEVYAQIGSLRKLCQEAKLDISIVRNGFRNLSRVPTELRELVMDDKLIADPILAAEIAVYATDYFEWDQEEYNTNEVIIFAKNIAQKFKDTLELRSEFFATKDDYSKPISASSKKNNEINAILEDWPVKKSKYEFNRFTDRSGRQYNFIVKFSKDIDAARFLRRWEYEKGRRISKKWASEMIDQIKNQGNAKEFVKDHSNEFNN